MAYNSRRAPSAIVPALKRVDRGQPKGDARERSQMSVELTEHEEIRAEGFPPSTVPSPKRSQREISCSSPARRRGTPSAQRSLMVLRLKPIRFLENIERVLTAARSGMNHVVKVTAHLADLTRDRASFNLAYTDHFQAPLPARTTVGSQLNGFLVEIDVIALRHRAVG